MGPHFGAPQLTHGICLLNCPFVSRDTNTLDFRGPLFLTYWALEAPQFLTYWALEAHLFLTISLGLRGPSVSNSITWP